MNTERVPPKIYCNVRDAQFVTTDIIQLFLRPGADQTFSYRAGQYLKIHLTHELTLPISIASAPEQGDELELHIKVKRSSEVFQEVFRQAVIDRVLAISGPYGNCTLNPASQRPLLLLAAGTGFGQIKALAEDALHKSDGRDIRLYWGARREKDLYMLPLLERWVSLCASFRFTPVLSDDTHGWNGRTGYVQDAALQEVDDIAEHDVYASGPREMVLAAYQAFAARGLPRPHIHADALANV
ncbi:MAG: 2-polyprenylphenol 6-hydroxylase [Gammaproteobacteria bacterium]|nr:MAG: 2-polyprenylphenol 6-hydroxylase [Gammaproteobacteria bacterium]TND04975.1 MAG: 2-polyprenylphenol 6-hydroxylase [Gammaproteobacteria bacterium]